MLQCLVRGLLGQFLKNAESCLKHSKLLKTQFVPEETGSHPKILIIARKCL